MAEMFKSKRVKFPKGKQKMFIHRAMKTLKLSNNGMAELLNVSVRTLNDWKREKFLISLKAVKLLSRKSGIKLAKNIKILNPFWYTKKGAKIGGINMYKKYGWVGGDPENRKRKWQEWWEQKGRFKKHLIINKTLPIKKPMRSEELAEFTGIVMGDGGISKYQLTITLNFKNDKEYIKFVIKLIEKLFGVKPSVYREEKNSVDNVVVSRVKLIKFCTEKLGLKVGNKVKQQVDIPQWIKINKKFQIACVRGLIDTDGSVFTHRYRVNDKLYNYKKLAFTSRSRPLVISVYDTLRSVGLNPRLAQQGRDVRLDSIEDMKKYFNIINSHNPKHLKRYKNYDTK